MSPLETAAQRYAWALRTQGHLAEKLHAEGERLALLGKAQRTPGAGAHYAEIEHDHGLACDELDEAEHELLVLAATSTGVFTAEEAEAMV